MLAYHNQTRAMSYLAHFLDRVRLDMLRLSINVNSLPILVTNYRLNKEVKETLHAEEGSSRHWQNASSSMDRVTESGQSSVMPTCIHRKYHYYTHSKQQAL